MSTQPHPAGVRLLPWRIPPSIVDATLIGIAVLGFLRRPFAETNSFETINWFALVASVALLLTRRRYPVPSLITAVATSMVVVGISDRPSMLLPVTLAILFTVGLQCERKVSLIAGGMTTVLFGGLVIVLLSRGTVDGAGLASIAWPAFAVTAGIGIRASRLNLAAAQERAIQAETSRELESERRVIEERLRIARDVHDLVAHHIAVINVQSGVAGHLVTSDPDAAAEALGIVRGAAATVIDELGDLLGVLRSPDDVDEPVAPTPDLAAIEDLISSFDASGLLIRRESSGTRREFSDSAQLAAYRVVQEALTNAHKYGRGAVDIALRFSESADDIIISNSVDPDIASGNGYGLVGMKERIDAVGGTLSAKKSSDGAQFDLAASIPTRSIS